MPSTTAAELLQRYSAEIVGPEHPQGLSLTVTAPTRSAALQTLLEHLGTPAEAGGVRVSVATDGASQVRVRGRGFRLLLKTDHYGKRAATAPGVRAPSPLQPDEPRRAPIPLGPRQATLQLRGRSPSEVLGSALEEAAAVLPCDTALLLVPDGYAGLRVEAALGDESRRLVGRRLDPGAEEGAMLCHRPLLKVEPVAVALTFRRRWRLPLEARVQSTLSAPVLCFGRLVGVLVLLSKDTPYTDLQLAELEAIARDVTGHVRRVFRPWLQASGA